MRVLLEVKIHERRQEDDEKEMEVFFDISCIAYIISVSMEIRDEKKTPYALFYMDLDLFKPVNDTYGHEMGDKVLKEVAKRLLMCIRSNDYAFRIGGDEFMLILKGNLDAQICEKRIERIKKLIGEPYEFDGYTIKIGISCGSAVYPDDVGCASDIQKIADKRMYEDKKINHAKR